MTLPHNAYLTSVPLKDAISSALSNRTVEVNLAVSHDFYDFWEEYSEVETPYLEYFDNTAHAIANILGDPIYRGSCEAPATLEWISALELHASAVHLVVWERDNLKLYLRYGWEDKEIPIVVALGTEGCNPNWNY